MVSTSSTQIEIQTPFSAESSPPGPNVLANALLPLPPCPFSHRKISHSPEQTPPKWGGVPHSQPLVQPRRSNQAKLSTIFDTFRIGVSRFASMVSSPWAIRS